MRTLFARSHATIYPEKGVFLAGPTPPDGEMLEGWRRKVIRMLQSDHTLSDDCVVVSPEPVDGHWSSIVSHAGIPNENAENDQIAWELQYLNLCHTTAFWLPVYWDSNHAEHFPPNIGPTTRWEFGMVLERFLNQPRRRLIVGATEDAQSIGWVRHACKHNRIDLHILPKAEKSKLVSRAFVDAIAQSLGSE